MRYLSFVRGAENQGPPPPALMAAMDRLMAESFADGSLIQTGGLGAGAQGILVRLENGKMTVTDGPFTESKEIIGGYAVLEAATREDAIESARRFMQVHADHWPEWRGSCEVREIAFLAP